MIKPADSVWCLMESNVSSVLQNCFAFRTCGEEQGILPLKAARSNTSYTEKVCDRKKTLAAVCILSVIHLNTGEHTEWCTVVMVRRI